MAAEAADEAAAAAEGALEVSVKWNGKLAKLQMGGDSTVGDLKKRLHEEFGVLPKRQKLMGLKAAKGKMAEDDARLSDLKIKASKPIMMMGTLEKDLEEKLTVPDDIGDVVDDLIVDDEIIEISKHPDNLAKIAKRVETYELNIISPPRENKKLLVLDIDYTLYDHRSNAENFQELTRPYLHEFLSAAYKHYDIGIWSATSMKWIEVKMKEIGVADHPDYRITFYMDSKAMINVLAPKYGVVDVKPLGVIWGKLSEFYRPGNTIMFDDLRRNFLMNPDNGLRIRACRELPLNRHADDELLHLTKYLEHIAELDDEEFAKLDHREWRRAIGHK